MTKIVKTEDLLVENIPKNFKKISDFVDFSLSFSPVEEDFDLNERISMNVKPSKENCIKSLRLYIYEKQCS